MLFLRRLADGEAQPLFGTENASRPFFSPDGQSVGFIASGKLMTMSLTGSPPVTLATANGIGAWVTDDRIVFVKRTDSSGPFRLYSISATGGTPQLLPDRKNDVGYAQVAALPGRKAVVFVIGREIAALNLETGDIKIVAHSGFLPRYVSSGHLVYLQTPTSDQQSTLMAVPFDPTRLEPTGPAVPVAQGILQDLFAVSENGLLVYCGADAATAAAVWVDRQGHRTSTNDVMANYVYPRLSPDGRRVAVGIGSAGDVWIVDLIRGSKIPLTHGDRTAGPPGSIVTNAITAWTHDSNYVTFSRTMPSGEVRLEQMAADGTGRSETLYSIPNILLQPGSWSESDRLLAFHSSNVRLGSDRDLWVWRNDDRKAEEFLATSFKEDAPRFSPDGHWIAYVSDLSGRDEVYVRRYPERTDTIPVSTAGGTEPVWSRNGHELFYRNGKKLMSVVVDSKPLRLSPPVQLFEGDYRRDPSIAGAPNYDIAADGKFLMLQDSVSPAGIGMSVIINWQEELKRLAPTSKK